MILKEKIQKSDPKLKARIKYKKLIEFKRFNSFKSRVGFNFIYLLVFLISRTEQEYWNFFPSFIPNFLIDYCFETIFLTELKIVYRNFTKKYIEKNLNGYNYNFTQNYKPNSLCERKLIEHLLIDFIRKSLSFKSIKANLPNLIQIICERFLPVNTTFLTFSGLQYSHPSYQIPKNSCSHLTNAIRYEHLASRKDYYPFRTDVTISVFFSQN
ncbi:hypothetical protein BpHYR1_006956 [Brachionus plicatilis]|uniref:Uncharacterized protein n=1 Tax=Brachionus plicatilis TaxID=10195 RepID=A0A3M7RK17_BRAPC|nr:hypothetical protein BpHYR1_006956 [Brachionus plicatilis]